MDNEETARDLLQKRLRLIKTDPTANDQISSLPDELLFNIFSRITFRDTASFSPLSHRWKNLWRENTQWNLEIPEEIKRRVARDHRNYRKIHTEILKHTRRVNRAVQSHEVLHLDELKISAYRDARAPAEVHNWIKFAIRTGVKTFYVKFDNARIRNVPLARYSFPSVEELSNLMDPNTNEGLLHHSRRGIPEKHQIRSFCCLQSISLGDFDVSDEVISYFLRNCTFLEFLRVECSDTLLNVRIDDGVRLKRLEIVRCLKFESLKIYAKSLCSLVYVGNSIDFPFQVVPSNLLELTIGEKFGESFAFEQEKHLAYLSHVETLRYAVTCKVHKRICRDPYSFPTMINLKHLDLQVPIGLSLVGYTTFFIAAPNLSTLKMEYRLRRLFDETEEERQEREDADEVHEEAMGVHHRHLQEVELIGFHDELIDIRFAKHLISRIAVCLKKMVVRFRHNSGTPEAMRHVKEELQGKMPAGAKLLILKTCD